MSEVTTVRNTTLKLEYNHHDITEELHKHLLDWTFTDNLSGEIDSFDFDLIDRDMLWTGKWFPSKGSMITPIIIRNNWEEKAIITRLGKFEIDEIKGKGFGTTISIGALAASDNSSLRGEEKNQAWEKVTVKTVLNDVAKRNKMKLVWQVTENPKKDRIEQENETDLKFIYRLCKDNGYCLKLANNTIVVLDESDYEKQAAITDIRRLSLSTDKIKILNYSFNTSATGTYKACRVEHYDSKKKKRIAATFTAPKAKKVDRTLVVKEEVKSQAEALRLAKKKLREANKNATTISLEIYTSMHIDAGMTFNLKGFGTLNGKYIVTKYKVKPNSQSIDLRRCLEGY